MWQRLALHGENESFKGYFVSEGKCYLIIIGWEIVLGIFLHATLFKQVGWRKSSLCVAVANEDIVLASGLCGRSYTRVVGTEGTFLTARLAGFHDGLWSHFDCLWIPVFLLPGDHPSIACSMSLLEYRQTLVHLLFSFRIIFFFTGLRSFTTGESSVMLRDSWTLSEL